VHAEKQHLRFLFQDETRHDLQLRSETGLQRSSNGSAPGRPGRILRHVRFPQWVSADDEGKLPDRQGRPAGHQAPGILPRSALQGFRGAQQAARDNRELSCVFLRAQGTPQGEADASAVGKSISFAVPKHPKSDYSPDEEEYEGHDKGGGRGRG